MEKCSFLMDELFVLFQNSYSYMFILNLSLKLQLIAVITLQLQLCICKYYGVPKKTNIFTFKTLSKLVILGILVSSKIDET